MVLVVLLGIKKAVLLSLRVFSLKRSTAGALVVPFRVLSRNNKTGAGDWHLTGDNWPFRNSAGNWGEFQILTNQ